MLGIPSETPETIKTTVKALAKLKPTLIRMTIFDPFYGTPLYDYCARHNLFKLDANQHSNHFTGSRLVFDKLTDEDIITTQMLFPWILNLELGLAEYERLIERFKNKNREDIIAADKNLSEQLSLANRGHFRYFSGNSFYFEYYPGG